MRPLWFGCGSLAMGLAIIGVFLPILPTVPFLLLAAICFSRSSVRAHKWLTEHDKFGPPIRDWRERGAISRQAKWLATLFMAAALAISYVMDVQDWLAVLQAVVIAGVAAFIWSRPDA